MELFKDERAENPIEVGLYILLAIGVMAFLMLTVGALLDAFNVQVQTLITANPLSSWGSGVMSTYLGYISYAYYVPSIFLAILFIWGVRAVTRKHTYTTGQDPQYMNTEEF